MIILLPICAILYFLIRYMLCKDEDIKDNKEVKENLGQELIEK